MARKSSVKRLPVNVVKAINFQLEKERLTLDDIVDWLERDHGYKISRSALGRYSKDFSDIRQQLGRTREIAESFARELGPDAVTGKQGTLLVEMMHSLLFRFIEDEITAEDGEEKSLNTKDFMQLCRAIKDAASANRLTQDFETKLREQIRKEATEKAVKAVEETAAVVGEKGLSAETVDLIKSRILGIDKPVKSP